MNKKRSVFFIITISLLFFLCCVKKDPTILRVSLWDYNHWVDDEFFKNFQKKHPNIKLKIESESWSNYHTKLNTQIITKTAPDVMLFKASDIYGYCEKNALLDISKLIENERYPVDSLFPNSVESCKWKGKIYGLPISNNVSAIYLNQDLFEKYDIDVPSSDTVMNWQDFQQLCQEFSNKIKNNPENQIDFVYVENVGWMEMYSAILQNDSSPFDKLENPQKCLLNTPKALEACNYYFNFSLKYGYSPTLLEYISHFKRSPSELFYQQKFPIYLGQLGLRFLNDPNRGFRVKVIPRPKGKNRATFVLVNVATINPNTRHLNESWELLKYLTSVESQKYIARKEALGGFIPSLKEVAYSDDLFPNHPVVRKVILEELENSVPLMKVTSKELPFAINPVLERLAMKQISINEAMKEITEKVNKILSSN